MALHSADTPGPKVSSVADPLRAGLWGVGAGGQHISARRKLGVR